jgi:hypothetical protein
MGNNFLSGCRRAWRRNLLKFTEAVLEVGEKLLEVGHRTSATDETALEGSAWLRQVDSAVVRFEDVEIVCLAARILADDAVGLRPAGVGSLAESDERTRRLRDTLGSPSNSAVTPRPRDTSCACIPTRSAIASGRPRRLCAGSLADQCRSGAFSDIAGIWSKEGPALLPGTTEWNATRDRREGGRRLAAAEKFREEP